MGATFSKTAQNSYVVDEVEKAYALEMEIRDGRWEEFAHKKGGGWASDVLDFLVDILSFGFLGGASSTGHAEAAPMISDVNGRADLVVKNIESFLGFRLDGETRENIRKDVFEIWGARRPQPKRDVTIRASVGARAHNQRDDVKAIQQLLNQKGVKPPLSVDGVVGPKTIGAIKKFQSSFMKHPDGRVDPGLATLRHLNSASKRR